MLERSPGEDSLAERLFWSRHANPWSVWTYVLAFPTLVLALYRRDVRLLGGTFLFVAVNPLVFRPPETDEAWATRVVLGERVWLERGVWPSRETAISALAAPLYLYTLRAAVRRQPVRTAAGTLVSMIVMLAFFAHLARLYDEHASE